MTFVQAPSIILPTVWRLGTETETIDDIVEHTSLEFPSEFLQEKMISIIATEVVVAGVPGVLNLWVEVSPVSSLTSGSYWAAIGGGGGALAPVAPILEVATGVMGTVHTISIPWTIHSNFARLVVQTPVAAALPTAYWAVQAIIGAKTP